MKKIHLFKNSCIALCAATVLIGCGGGGGGSASSSNNGSSVSTGSATLIDAPVDGVVYKNGDGRTYYTEGGGKFSYNGNSNVEFYVGKIKIGEIAPSSITSSNLHIQEIVGVSKENVNDAKVLKVARLLQSLDSDNDPSNGIKIEKSTTETINNHSSMQGNIDDIADVDAAIRMIDPGITPVSESAAKTHLRQQLNKYGVTPDESAPTAVMVSQNRIHVTDNIILRFSEKMKASSISRANIILRKTSNNAVVPASYQYNAQTNTLVLDPTSNLDYAQSYQLQITTNVKDAADNPITSAQTLSITTNSEPDGTIPTVSLKNTSVGITDNLELSFSEPMATDTISKTNILLKDVGNNNLDTNVTYNSATNTAVINPDNNLAFSTEYRIVVKKAVTDLAGNAIETSGEDTKLFTFTTKEQGDVTAPTIASTTLDSSSDNVAVNSNFSVTFSEEIDQKTLAGNVVIRQDGKSFDVGCALTYSGNTATLNPTNDLTKGASYKLIIKTGVQDTSGNALSAGREVAFNVEREQDLTRPDLVANASNLSDGDSAVALDKTFTFTFDEELKSSSVNSTTVLLKDSVGNSVDSNVSYASNVVSLDPNADLAKSTKYYLTLTSNIEDLSGNKFDGITGLSGLRDRVFTFTTDTTGDTVAPKLLSAVYSGGIDLNATTTMPIDSNITLTFDKDLSESTLSKYISVVYDTNKTFSTYSLNYKDRKVTLEPYSLSKFSYATTYTLKVGQKLKDLARNTLTAPIDMNFTTIAQADTTKPEINYDATSLDTSSVSSKNKEVALDANMTVVFNEDLKPSTVTANNVALLQKGNTNNLLTDADITYSNKTITVDPSTNLAPETEYILRIKKDGVEDLAGNKFDGAKFLHNSDETFTFTTTD